MTALTTTAPGLPALYDGGLIDLDQSDLATKRIQLVQGNTRLRNIIDGLKLGDVLLTTNAEDPMAEKIGGVDSPFTLYVLAVSKGVVHIDKDNNGRITFLTGEPDAEVRLAQRERDIWRSYHYVVKVEGHDEPVSWMLTGYSGTQTAKDVNTMVVNQMKVGKAVTPMQIQPKLKSNGANTWTILKAFPTVGDPVELAEAEALLASGIDRMKYRAAENDAPLVTEEPAF